ncbi:hypothetical protein ONZ45_g15781 [Pleurotus djamor]|nr:hypothetical protein ONZ45_g15781 [Pleurotus djamor]
MSYNPYTPPPTGTPPTSTQYPYGTYFVPGAYGQHAAYPATYAAGANPYQTGVTSYGWTYQYPYLQHHHPGQIARPASSTGRPATPTTSTTTTTAARAATPVATTSTAGLATSNAAVMPQRTSNSTNANFSTLTPYARDTSYSSGGGTRVKNLMYGFGDDRNPANDSVNVMEEILVEFILDVCNQAATPMGTSRKARLGIEDLRRVLSRPADAKKLARMEELLFMQEDIKRARAEFDDDEMAGTGGSKP